MYCHYAYNYFAVALFSPFWLFCSTIIQVIWNDGVVVVIIIAVVSGGVGGGDDRDGNGDNGLVRKCVFLFSFSSSSPFFYCYIHTHIYLSCVKCLGICLDILIPVKWQIILIHFHLRILIHSSKIYKQSKMKSALDWCIL